MYKKELARNVKEDRCLNTVLFYSRSLGGQNLTQVSKQNMCWGYGIGVHTTTSLKGEEDEDHPSSSWTILERHQLLRNVRSNCPSTQPLWDVPLVQLCRRPRPRHRFILFLHSANCKVDKVDITCNVAC